MPMTLYNTMTRRKEEFAPLAPPQVRLYCCGVTVYNYAHIGNLRTYLFEDILRRALRFNGYDLVHVQNVTDVGHTLQRASSGSLQTASERRTI